MKKFLDNKRVLIRIIFFLLFDAIFIALSVYFAFLLRFEGQIPSRYFLNIGGIIFLASLITLPIFYFLKLYSFSWAYVSTEELISLAKGTSLGFLLLAASFFILRGLPVFTGFPRSTLFITYFFIFIFCGGIRFSKRFYLQIVRTQTKENKERTLIVGAGDAGEQLLRSIMASKESHYFPVGFIDDNPAKQGIVIHGLRVLGKLSDISRLTRRERIKNLIIALPSAGSRAIGEAVERGRKAGLRKIKIVPPLSELIGGEADLGNLREVRIADLLGREAVAMDTRAIENFIQNKTVLITGAAGSIGSELCRQAAKFRPSQLLLLDQDETGIFNISEELEDRFPKLKITSEICDIRDREKIERIFNKFRPSVIFHAAAYKHVPLMELHPDEAVKNNIFGTKIVAETALKWGAEKLIFVSTDKSVNPASVMGATKRAGEMICQSLNKTGPTKFISVRFGNVLASRGSVIPIFEEKIKKREALEVTHPEMKRYFMTSSEACLLVLQASQMGKGGEVFVLDMGKPIRILDLAKEMIRLSGLEPDKDIPIVITQPRPGEKFFEETLTAEEGTEATYHQKIFMAKLSGNVDENKLNFILKKIKIEAEAGNSENIKKNLKEIIPTYNENLKIKE